MYITVLTIAEVVYVVGLSVWILLEKRSPAATIAWILSLIALPYVGFGIYFLLGPRRLDRKRLRHTRARLHMRSNLYAHAMTKAARATLDGRTEQLMALATKAGETQPSTCAELAIFHDAATCYAALEQAILQAKDHIHFGFYMWNPGRTGEHFRDLLTKRAKEGVAVRVLLDGVGSYWTTRGFFRSLIEAGGVVAWFNPVGLPFLRAYYNFRNHRKIVVCDGDVGFAGGVNITDEYRHVPDGAVPWRDTHLRLKGNATRGLALTFLDDWYFATGEEIRDPKYFPETEAPQENILQVVSSGPDQDLAAAQKVYFSAITGAQQRVLLTTPYFIPDEAVVTALMTAAMRGVDVRVLVPRRTDSLLVTAAARSYYDNLLRVGVRIYEYLPTMLHAKTLVIDDNWSIVGTANLDNRSFRLNFEVTVVLYGTSAAQELAAAFDRDLTKSQRIRAGDRARISFPWKLAEASARLLSPLL